MKVLLSTFFLLFASLSFTQEDYSELAAELADESTSIRNRNRRLKIALRGIHMQPEIKLQRLKEIIPLLTSLNEPNFYWEAHSAYGVILQEQGAAVESNEQFLRMLKFANEQQNDIWISESYMGLYKVYVEMQMEEKALESIKLAQEHAVKTGEADLIELSSYLLGYNYYTLGQNDSATYLMEMAIEYDQLNRPGFYNREYNYLTARIYIRDSLYQKGIDKLRGVYDYSIKTDDDYSIYYAAGALMYMAQSHAYLGQVDSSTHYFRWCLELYKGQDPLQTNLAYYYNAGTYARIGEYELAVPLFDFLIDSTDFPLELKEAARTYAYVKDYDRAVTYYDQAIREKDSIHTAAISEMTQMLDEQSEAELEIQIQVDEEKRIVAQQQADSQEKQKNLILIAAGIIGLLIVFFGRILYKRYQVIKLQKEEINQQKLQVEEKNEEILASINYAKRIQDAILPPGSLIKELLPDSFILYKPKDVVAGDFYWLEEVGDQIIFAAADCTGHGVPGAMVSVVCHNALNRSVREFGLLEPAKILDKTRELVIETFEKSEDQVKDGMDIALCALNPKTLALQFAGANNSLYYFNDGELIEVKADKQPIGVYTNQYAFTNHEVQLKKGSQLFIFTDGFADQFGGDKGKKFKPKNFRDLLVRYQDEQSEKQRLLLDTAFEKWRGEMEQVDDVCVIGVRL